MSKPTISIKPGGGMEMLSLVLEYVDVERKQSL